jgi:hypothetical protein
MRMNKRVNDEHFLGHSRRSTSNAGIVSGVLSLVLFEYHLLVEQVFRWELLAIGVTFTIIKVVSMLYYVRQDIAAHPMSARHFQDPPVLGFNIDGRHDEVVQEPPFVIPAKAGIHVSR